MSTLLITCRDKKRVAHYYVPALKAAGWHGRIELVGPSDPRPSLEGVAGLLLCGGADIHPERWDASEAVHPKAEPDPERDAAEIPLIQAAWEKNVPILGICRGHQILNVALGGSMIQDIPDHFGCASELHRHGNPEVPEVRHEVFVTHGSRLASLLGSHKVPVNSRHHQAVKEVAPELQATAYHPGTLKDGVPLIEGIEAKDPHRWVVGVQWHPENLAVMQGHAGDASRGLFTGFIQAVEAFAERSAEVGA